MAFTRTWQEANPNDDNFGFELDDYQRQTRQDVRERAAVQHQTYLDESGHSDVWEHSPGKCTIVYVGTKATFPTPSTTTKGCIAIATDEGNQIYYWNGASWTKIQEPVLLTGNQTIAGIKTFSSAPSFSTPITVPDTSQLATAAAPAADAQIANKKYVDDNDAVLDAKFPLYWKGVNSTNVLNGQLTSAYNNDIIDCSGIVGANSALILAYVSVDSSNRAIFIRDSAGGLEIVHHISTGYLTGEKNGPIIFKVDTDGKADAKARTYTQTWNIWVIGYFLL